MHIQATLPCAFRMMVVISTSIYETFFYDFLEILKRSLKGRERERENRIMKLSVTISVRVTHQRFKIWTYHYACSTKETFLLDFIVILKRMLSSVVIVVCGSWTNECIEFSSKSLISKAIYTILEIRNKNVSDASKSLSFYGNI